MSAEETAERSAANEQHLALIKAQIARLEARLARLKAEVARIEGDGKDPASTWMDDWLESMAKKRSPYAAQCEFCDRWFKSRQGVDIHKRTCMWYRQWKRDFATWVKGGKQGPAPKRGLR